MYVNQTPVADKTIFCNISSFSCLILVRLAYEQLRTM
jgi:hypothetical protein